MGLLDFLKGTKIASVKLHHYPLSATLIVEGELPAGVALLRLFLHYFDLTMYNARGPDADKMVSELHRIAPLATIESLVAEGGKMAPLGPWKVKDVHAAGERPLLSSADLFERNGFFQCVTGWTPLTHPRLTECLALGGLTLFDACLDAGNASVRRQLPRLCSGLINDYMDHGAPSITTIGNAPRRIMLAFDMGEYTKPSDPL